VTDVDKQSLELLLAQGVSVERIAKRFGKDPSTISYWMKKFGLESAHAEKHRARGGIERSRLEELVEAGMTIAEIALEVERFKATVRHWLQRHGLRTKSRRGRRTDSRARAPRAAGELATRLTCPRHGETEFSLEGRGYYRCKRCRSEAITRRRRKMKEILVDEAGGHCCLCGYDACLAALEFHHLDPLEKRLEINAKGTSLALDTLRAEARKCVLLCSNCHAEVEVGVTEVPLELRRDAVT
jgi:transposase-like protein